MSSSFSLPVPFLNGCTYPQPSKYDENVSVSPVAPTAMGASCVPSPASHAASPYWLSAPNNAKPCCRGATPKVGIAPSTLIPSDWLRCGH